MTDKNETEVPKAFADKQRADDSAVYLRTAIDTLCAEKSITEATADRLQCKVRDVLLFIRGLNG